MRFGSTAKVLAECKLSTESQSAQVLVIIWDDGPQHVGGLLAEACSPGKQPGMLTWNR